MVSEQKVHGALSKMYVDFMDEIDFEMDLAKNGRWQWKGVSEDMKLGAQYAYEASRNVFINHFKKACGTQKK